MPARLLKFIVNLRTLLSLLPWLGNRRKKKQNIVG